MRPKSFQRTVQISRKILTVGGTLLVFGALSPDTMLAMPPAAESLMREYYQGAKALDPNFKAFSAAAGRALYTKERMHSKEKNSRSCATCHTPDPKFQGKTLAGKSIDPLSPLVNPKRLTEEREIRKWFFRNCNQVLERDCTPVEKGNFLQYLFSTST